MRDPMTAKMVRTLAVLTPVLASTAALAADDGHGGGHAQEFLGPIALPEAGLLNAIAAILVFGVAFLLLSAKVWPMIQKGLSDRENKILEEIAAAEAAREQAKAALEEYEQSLSKARAEAQAMIEETKTKQSELAAELRAKADAELTAMRQKAMSDIDAARKAAIAEIYEESVTLATSIAGKILQREVNPGDTDRLVSESLAELRASGSISNN